MSASIWPIEIALSKPLEAHGETLETLTLKEPVLGNLDGVEIAVSEKHGVRINLGDLHLLVGRLAGIPPRVARKIALTDLKPAVDALTDFFASSLGSGES